MREQTILIADDQMFIRRIISDYLENANYHVMEAKNGREALEFFCANQQTIDLVILDIMMPEMDGLEVCERIRDISSVPVIMLTASDDDNNEIKGLRLGVDEYMKKPFDNKELVQLVNRLLGNSNMQNQNVINL